MRIKKLVLEWSIANSLPYTSVQLLRCHSAAAESVRDSDESPVESDSEFSQPGSGPSEPLHLDGPRFDTLQ